MKACTILWRSVCGDTQNPLDRQGSHVRFLQSEMVCRRFLNPREHPPDLKGLTGSKDRPAFNHVLDCLDHLPDVDVRDRGVVGLEHELWVPQLLAFCCGDDHLIAGYARH